MDNETRDEKKKNSSSGRNLNILETVTPTPWVMVSKEFAHVLISLPLCPKEASLKDHQSFPTASGHNVAVLLQSLP